MSRYRFAVVGDTCVDGFHPPIGGNAVNVAVQLALLGHDVAYFGAVGNDAEGRRTLDSLRRNGVTVDHVQILPGEIACADLILTPEADHVFTDEKPGVCQHYCPSEADFGVLAGMDHVHIGWIRDDGAVRRRLATEKPGVSQEISGDHDGAHARMDTLTIAFGSAGEDRVRATLMLVDFLTAGVRVGVVTRGSHGPAATNGRAYAETGIGPFDVVDTAGAGDSFIAGFLHAFLAGEGLEACLLSGRECAARTCVHAGGVPQQPHPL